MKILLTGASGFLGKKLIDRLLEEGHGVACITYSNEPDNVKSIEADITKLNSLRKVKQEVGEVEAVIHMAANVPKTAEQDQLLAMTNINIEGTANILEVFGQDITTFVYASTAEVYGLPNNSEKISESYNPEPLSYYAATKLAGEYLCSVYGKKNNLPISILRFTVLYGPGDTINRAIPNFINKALKSEELEVYGGEELRDYLHVDDAVEALYLAAIGKASGIFNIGSGKAVAVKDAAEIVTRKISDSKGLKILPRQKEAADIVLDISKAESELGFKPKNMFPDRIDEQIEWHKTN